MDEVEGKAKDLLVDDFLPEGAPDDDAFPEADADGFTIVPAVECEGLALEALLDDDEDDGCETEPPVLLLLLMGEPFAVLPALRRPLGTSAPGSVFFAGVMVGLTLRCCPSPVFDGPLPLTPCPDLWCW